MFSLFNVLAVIFHNSLHHVSHALLTRQPINFPGYSSNFLSTVSVSYPILMDAAD